MATKSKLAIRAAVMNCMAKCSESDASLCCLGDFLEKLAEMRWGQGDIKAVEFAVLRLLGKLPPTGQTDSLTARVIEVRLTPETSPIVS